MKFRQCRIPAGCPYLDAYHFPGRFFTDPHDLSRWPASGDPFSGDTNDIDFVTEDKRIQLDEDQIRRYHAETPEEMVPQMLFTATEAIGFAYGVTWNLARRNLYILIDEAHRTTGGDLGNFLMTGLPNASYIGFTGTPVDKTAYGKGTFKTFGCENDRGYLHKYSISESIEDGATLPLYYNLAPNEMLVPHEIMEKEFLALAETEGIADIEELNKILDRVVNLKNFLKGRERVPKVARFVADHFRQNVEPLGYKAFLVAVDREACALYKEALDGIFRTT